MIGYYFFSKLLKADWSLVSLLCSLKFCNCCLYSYRWHPIRSATLASLSLCFDSLIQETLLIETGYHIPTWPQTQLTSEQNQTGNVKRKTSSWLQYFSDQSPPCSDGAEVSSLITIESKAVTDSAASVPLE